MSAIAAAIAGGVAAAGAIGGAVISSNAAKDSAKTQADAASNAANLQYQEFQQQQQNQKPWLQAGTQALSQMQDPAFQHSFTMADFHADPAYQFNLDQGQQALERSAAARGGLMSGGTLKDLTKYAQGMASNEYQNAYNRFTNDQSTRFNRLASIAGVGQTATGMLNNAGMNMANNMGNIMTSNANAQGAASIAQGNVWGNTLSGLGNSLGNNLMQYQMMKQMPQIGMGGMGGGMPMSSGSLTMPELGSSAGFGSSPAFTLEG